MGSGPSRPYESGFRILNVLPTGAAANTIVFPDSVSSRSPTRRTARISSLVPWLDFIISINGQNLNEIEDAESVFASEIMTTLNDPHSNHTLILEIYNLKRNAIRTVQITLNTNPLSPSLSIINTDNNNNTLSIPAPESVTVTNPSSSSPDTDNEPSPPILGAVITWETIPEFGITEIPLHVTEIEPNTPAANAGLVVNDDYILGCTINNITYGFEDNESFSNAVYDSRGSVLLLYVYCINNDTIRLVELEIPESGKGLGLGIACGSFHQLPSFTRETDGVNIIDTQRGTPVAVLPLEAFVLSSSSPTSKNIPLSPKPDIVIPTDNQSPEIITTTNSNPAIQTNNNSISNTIVHSSPIANSTNTVEVTPVPTISVTNTFNAPTVTTNIPSPNIIPTVVPPPVAKFMPNNNTNTNISSSITPFGSSDMTKKEGTGALSLSLLSHLPPPRTLPVNESPVKEETIDWQQRY